MNTIPRQTHVNTPSHARHLAELTPAARRTTVVEAMVRLFGPQASDPIDVHEKQWAEDEWARGGYFGIVAAGGWSAIGSALVDPVGPVHFAGSETAGSTYGSMDGAIRAGRRAADEVAHVLRTVGSAQS